MKTIRTGVFETNSSSTHSITMCMESDFIKWKNGEMYWDRWSEDLVSKEKVEKDDDIYYDKRYYTYNEFNNYLEYETFEDTYKTPQGEKVVCFGYYGYEK